MVELVALSGTPTVRAENPLAHLASCSYWHVLSGSVGGLVPLAQAAVEHSFSQDYLPYRKFHTVQQKIRSFSIGFTNYFIAFHGNWDYIKSVTLS